MKEDWVNHALRLAKEPADLYAGSRKILRNRILTFDSTPDILLTDAGYSKAKMSQLRRNYLHQDSITSAAGLWEEYREKPKYRSVAISCFGRLVKDHGGPRGSKMGSCLLAGTITMFNRKRATVNLHYRTTEFLKKFPADLIFVFEEILSQFNFEGMEIEEVTCLFDNVTIHPQYFTTIIPHLEDPIQELTAIRKKDDYFHSWIVKWVGRMLIEEQGRGIAKFAQAIRVKMDAEKRISEEMKAELIPYIKKWHPGFRNTSYAEAEESLK